jgi:hypothetical protein
LDAKRRRESLTELSGKNIVATNSSNYSNAQPAAPPASPKILKKWTPPSPKIGVSSPPGSSQTNVPFSSSLNAASADSSDTTHLESIAEATVDDENISREAVEVTTEASGDELAGSFELQPEAVEAETVTNNQTSTADVQQIPEAEVEVSVADIKLESAPSQSDAGDGINGAEKVLADAVSSAITVLESEEEQALTTSLANELQQADMQHGKLSTHSVALAERLGTDLKRKRIYPGAEVFYKEVLRRREEMLGQTHLETIDGGWLLLRQL